MVLLSINQRKSFNNVLPKKYKNKFLLKIKKKTFSKQIFFVTKKNRPCLFLIMASFRQCRESSGSFILFVQDLIVNENVNCILYWFIVATLRRNFLNIFKQVTFLVIYIGLLLKYQQNLMYVTSFGSDNYLFILIDL